jgi:hypothetical protein
MNSDSHSSIKGVVPAGWRVRDIILLQRAGLLPPRLRPRARAVDARIARVLRGAGTLADAEALAGDLEQCERCMCRMAKERR